MYCPSIILKIIQIWQSCIDFITEDILSAHAGLFPWFGGLYMLVSSLCHFTWRIMMWDQYRGQQILAGMTPKTSDFLGLEQPWATKPWKDYGVASRHLPFTVHFDTVRIVISSYGWWSDDVLCLFELNELKSEVSFVCKWVGVHWTHPISCLIFMPRKWGIALPFCAKGLYRKP